MPLITQFYGAFQDAYQIFLVMEYCAGGDLLDRLLEEGRAMPERRVILEVAVPLLKTLQHLHSYSIIHRFARLCKSFAPIMCRLLWSQTRHINVREDLMYKVTRILDAQQLPS